MSTPPAPKSWTPFPALARPPLPPFSISAASTDPPRRPAGRGRRGAGATLSLAVLLWLTLLSPVRAEEPLWGETASTLGKGFLNVTTLGDFSDYKPYRHHRGPVTLAIDRTELA